MGILTEMKYVKLKILNCTHHIKNPQASQPISKEIFVKHQQGHIWQAGGGGYKCSQDPKTHK